MQKINNLRSISMSKNKLDQLKNMTTVVVDTGDIDAIKAYTPTDATTNPSLILSASQKPQYQHLIKEAIRSSKAKATSKEDLNRLLMDNVFVNFGQEILKHIPGRVSTEVDARLSFDIQGSINKARSFVTLYELLKIPRERILIKLASTWEGACAAKILEAEGIHVNMTLMFSLPQAIICAEAKATLISPFVGRILDWYKKNEGFTNLAPAEDPGVQSVSQIYSYYKQLDYKTQIMGASFRNMEEITELAGCDLLTISPHLLEELRNAEGYLTRKLDPQQVKDTGIKKLMLSESDFRFMLNDNAMATEKLAEGIRNFAKDAAKLEQYILSTFAQDF
jgi:transaldolase